MTIEIVAYTACFVLVSLGLFQIALIAGAPLGNYAWGGAHRILPTKLRIGSVVSIILYTVFAIILLNKAGIVSLFSNVDVATWALTVYFFVGVLMNGISRSKKERAVMTPVALLLAVLSLVIALS
jgi:uncharacterized membrane protein